jgi:hypothetical protein
VSNPLHLRRAGPAALAVGLALAALPAAAQAAPVLLGTAAPFVVLGGSKVANTGPSVLNGDLGISPGTALTGFGTPPSGLVNGATHNNDAVALQAQNDMTTAYNTAAANDPSDPSSDLTGQNLGGKILLPGRYNYTSSAQLTGTLVLDAQNVAGAQFVIQVGTALTTASASAVELRGGASPCNVYWQIGSSATLGTGTAFQGNVLAGASISLTDAATVKGRLLAKAGITLINNVIDGSMCGTSTTPPGGTGGTGTLPGSGGAGAAPPASHTALPTRNGTARLRPAPRAACTAGFRASVRGHLIRRVVFKLDDSRIRSMTRSPFTVLVRAKAGTHHVTARVTFKDDTRAKTLRLGYRACAAAVLQPRRGPSRFTG